MDFFDTPSIWTLLIVALPAAIVAALVVKFLSPPKRPPFREGLGYALAELYLAKNAEEVADLLEARSGSEFDEAGPAREFDRGVIEGIRLYGRAQEAGALALEALQFRLNHMVNTGEASLSEVCVALNVIDDELIAVEVGTPTTLEPTP
ncbi:RusA [Xanthomonas phage Elanor]|uniref:RusA n=1 Tax=Xanthomonas phage Elanor TaxID=2939127 RepID=A0A9E7E1G6_9CAUD|nr:RusA [Xanthomonas phage Elanor]URA06983.1 RusA [Xanthomonas phage Elanor]